MNRLVHVLLLGVVLVSACSTPPGRRAGVTEELDPAALRQAATAYRQLLVDPANEQPAAMREAGRAWLERYAGSPNEDHVLLLTGRAAVRTGDLALAQRLFERLDRLYPDSPHLVDASWLRAELARDAGRRFDEADALVTFYGIAPEDDVRRNRVRDRLRDLLEVELSTDEIERLQNAHPRSFIGSTAAWLVAQRRYEEGEDPGRVAERLQEFLREYPQSRFAEDARALLARLSETHGIRQPAGLDVGLADRIGLLAPLSGREAALGQAMFDGALLAIEEHNRAMLDSLKLVAFDTRSDEVVAVQAARRLIEQENVIAIVGALLSPTTVAVATLCQEREVPLVSPTATKETISDIGPYVFQTNLTKAVETAMVARAGVQALQRTRYGVLYPDDEQGLQLAEQFGREVVRWGGRVVVQRSFDPTATDFRDVMRELRTFAPEAVFVPASPSLMRLIAPQLVFHDLRAQLLGLSSWDNAMLLREAGSSMHRALFPSSAALISTDDEAHFDQLWSRRHRSVPRDKNRIDLKSYFAARRVIEALDRESGTTRVRLRDRIEDGFLAGDASGSVSGRKLERLRMIEEGEIVAFPTELFPLADFAVAPADTLELPFPIDFETP